MKQYVLGIDFGTSSVKTGVYDFKGNVVASASASYPLSIPKPGYAEQEVTHWWSALCKCTRELTEKKGVFPDSIAGVGVDATCCTVLFADKNMNILRPPILWMDMRASKQAKQITGTGHDMLKFNGYGNVSAESMPCKALWVKENEPDLYKSAKHVFEATDWLVYRLTGKLTASMGTIAARWYYDRSQGGWPISFYESFGLGDVIEKFPNRILDMGVNVGGMTEKAAEELGLLAGIPIAQGGADAFVGMIGLNVVKPGNIAMITGTSHLHLGLTKEEMHTKGIWGSYPDGVIPGLQLVEGGQTSTGGIINWFVEHFCGDVKAEAEKQGLDVYELLNKEASKIPQGSEGVIALDYFQGNRTPYADPDVRGMFYGLSIKHNVYHIYRAIIESICYGTEVIMQTFRNGGMHPNGIYICGGAVNSELWMQIHADVSNLPIYVPKVKDACSLGGAILATVACGHYGDIATAAGEMVSFISTVQPDEDAHLKYKFFVQKYQEIYALAKECMHEITNAVSS